MWWFCRWTCSFPVSQKCAFSFHLATLSSYLRDVGQCTELQVTKENKICTGSITLRYTALTHYVLQKRNICVWLTWHTCRAFSARVQYILERRNETLAIYKACNIECATCHSSILLHDCKQSQWCYQVSTSLNSDKIYIAHSFYKATGLNFTHKFLKTVIHFC